MKKSELKEFIREEIIGILSEVEVDDNMPDEDVMDKQAMAAAKKGDSITKTASKLADVTKEMKSVVNQWKKSEGAEKDSLLARLKKLTAIKKELESLVTPSIEDEDEI